MHDPPNVVAAATHPDPYPFYARLTAHQPFAWSSGVNAWIAASADAVEAVLASPLCRVRPAAEPVPAALAGTAAGELFGRFARMSDGAAHHSRRVGASAAIALLDPAEIAARAAECTHVLWVTHPDWRGDAGFRLPVHVVAGALGIRDSELDNLATQTTAFVRSAAPGADAETIARGADAATWLMECFSDDAIRQTPAFRALRNALGESADADRTAAANAIGLLFQAHDATAGLLGNAIVALAANPSHVDAFRDDVESRDAFIGEVLRYDPPVQNTRRWVAEDGIIAGQAVRAGDAVLVLLAAANRDPAANPDPHRFWPDRPDPRVFTLGHGAHACPGGAISRAIASAALGALIEIGADFGRIAGTRRYLLSPNGRIPLFGDAESAQS